MFLRGKKDNSLFFPFLKKKQYHRKEKPICTVHYLMEERSLGEKLEA
jgi:hypothetical protein